MIAHKLHDFFIPHLGNEYKPHALRPRRIIFHAASIVAIKLVVIGFILIMPLSAWLTPDVLTDQSRKIIELTNGVRLKANIRLLKQNDLLDQVAFAKTQDMLAEQYFAHVSPSNKGLSDWLKRAGYEYSIAGENLAMGFAGAKEVMKGWMESETHFSNIIDPNFSDIGLSAVSGPYKGNDTTLVAQIFGAPAEEIRYRAAINQKLPTNTRQERKVLSGRVLSADTTPPIIDLAKTRIFLSKPSGQDSGVIRAVVYSSLDTASVTVSLRDYRIKLEKDALEGERWNGSMIISDEAAGKIFNPVVMATVTLTDIAGNKTASDVGLENVVPIKPSAVSQYLFLKSLDSKYMRSLLSFSSYYYKFLLLVAIIALALNIVIEFRKQHPHIILSSLGFIALLLLAIYV